MSPGAHPAVRHSFEDPSQQIRLLQLNSSTSDIVSAELSTWGVSNVPAYEAISYRWGDSETDGTGTISIDGALHHVGWNCCYALRQARQHVQCRYVWVDAICINQDDPVEKGAQVGIMATIYQRSQRVLVSLGKATGDDDFLIDMLHQMNDSCSLVTKHQTPRGSWLYRLGQTTREKVIMALTAFGSKPYWSRLWIVQELYMAPSRLLLCGEKALDLNIIDRFIIELNRWFDGIVDEAEDISRDAVRNDQTIKDLAASFFADHHYETGKPMAVLIHKIADQRETLDVQKARGDWHQVLLRFERWQCSDLRDRIFSVLVLIVDHAQRFAPDYRKSICEVALDVLQCRPNTYESPLNLATVLCRILQLNETDEMKAIIRSRLSRSQPGLGALSSASPLPITVHDYCTIWKDAAGRFVVPAQSVKNEKLADVMSEWGVLRNGTSASDENKLPGNARAKAVSTAEGPFALVSTDVQPGDKLIMLEGQGAHTHADWPQLGLIMRKRTSRTFSIIGYALLCARFSICDTRYAPTKCGFPNLPHTPRHRNVFTAVFDPEDLLVFSCLTHTLDQQPHQFPTWCLDIPLMRPLSSAMSSYVIAAKGPHEWWEQGPCPIHS